MLHRSRQTSRWAAGRPEGRRHGLVTTVRVVLAWAVLLGAGPLLAADNVVVTLGAAPEAKGWEESMGLQSFRDDAVAPEARLFDSPDYQQQLLIPAPGERAYLLQLKDRTVRLLPAAAIAWTKRDLPAPDASQGEPAGDLALLAGVLEFEADGAHWSIRPQPALVGAVTLETLRRDKPEYFHAAGRYVPDAAAVKTLASVRGETRIVVFFGTWCLICKHYLPHFLKTIEAAANPRLRVEFVGVTEDHAEPAELLRQYRVDTSPVFVVFQEGKEVGRIEEEPDESVEQDLALILGGR